MDSTWHGRCLLVNDTLKKSGIHPLPEQDLANFASIAIILVDLMFESSDHKTHFTVEHANCVSSKWTESQKHEHEFAPDCRQCRMIDAWYKKHRSLQAQLNLYYSCFGEACSLYDMLYEIVRCYRRLDGDCDLHIQVLYALIQLHKQKHIWLTPNTVERYYVLTFLVFVDYYSETPWYLNRVYNDYGFILWADREDFRQALFKFAPLLFYVENIQSLYIYKNTTTWINLVEMINVHPDVKLLKKSLKCDRVLEREIIDLTQDDILTFKVETQEHEVSQMQCT